MNILVVEDESYVAELIQVALENLGNSCVLAQSAADADAMLSRSPIDAVTLDLGMPDRSGLDWLEHVAASQPGLAAKTLVITGMPLEPDMVERVARCGAGLLAKPFTLDSLSDAVRTQISHAETPRNDSN